MLLVDAGDDLEASQLRDAPALSFRVVSLPLTPGSGTSLSMGEKCETMV